MRPARLQRRGTVSADDEGTAEVVLEDQDGRVQSFEEYFHCKPSVVAFFHTRCENPYKCSLTVTKLAALQATIGRRGSAGTLRIAAITFDPDFDDPKRLKLYGADRGLEFGADARCFRATAGFEALSRRFGRT